MDNNRGIRLSGELERQTATRGQHDDGSNSLHLEVVEGQLRCNPTDFQPLTIFLSGFAQGCQKYCKLLPVFLCLQILGYKIMHIYILLQCSHPSSAQPHKSGDLKVQHKSSTLNICDVANIRSCF